MRRILALEFLGGVDGRLRLLAAVVDIYEIELRLARLRAERIARLQGAEVLDAAGEVRGVHRVVAALVKQLGALILDDVVAPAATAERDRGEA